MEEGIAATSGPAVVTGEALARAAAADFEEFFIPGLAVPVRINVDDVHAAVMKGIGKRTRIVIPREMAREVIDDPDRLAFHLIIVGHEIAHVVHRHNDQRDQGREDYRALEIWADFYGAKVMMCLLTYGARVRRIFRSLVPDEGRFEITLDAVGRALGRLVTGVYVEHSRYPYPLLRVGLVHNGVSSFLRRELPSGMDGWRIGAFKRLFASEAVRELMILNPEHAEPDFEPVERARRWHRALQGDAIAIAPWFLPHVVEHLHTSFQQTDEVREASRLERLRELQDAGLLPNDDRDAAGSRG